MTKKTIIQELEELASDETKRSKAARLRDIFDAVEATLATGVAIKEVVKKLSEHGIDMSIGSFKNEMHRIRKKRGKPSASLSKPEPKKAASSTIQEVSNKNSEQEQEPDYDELAVLSARERRERRIAQFTTDYEPPNPLLHFLKDKTK